MTDSSMGAGVASEIFIWGLHIKSIKCRITTVTKCRPGVMMTEVLQKLKQFADPVYRF